MKDGLIAGRAYFKCCASSETTPCTGCPVKVPLCIPDQAGPRVCSAFGTKAVQHGFLSVGINLEHRSAGVRESVFTNVIAAPASRSVQISFFVPDHTRCRVCPVGLAFKCVEDCIGLGLRWLGHRQQGSKR